jgi:signal transduction histidine kinase
MGTRTAARLAWSLWALTVALLVPGVLLWALGGFPPPPGSESVAGAGGTILVLTWALTYLTFGTMGLVIVARRPENPIGWLCAAAGLMMAMSMLASEYASTSVLSPPGSPAPGAAVIAWIGSLMGAWIGVFVPLILLFPDGRLPGRRWAVVLWTAGASIFLAVMALGLKPGPLGSAPTIENPFGLAAAAELLDSVLRLTSIALLVCAVLAAAALLLRLRRARGDERQQFKWVAYAAGLWALVLVGSFVAPAEWNIVAEFAHFLAVGGLLAAVALAILKYRLYDIDLVINRTLVYATLATLITALYGAIVVGLGALIGTRGEPNLGLSLLATAVVAVVFQSLRERVQRLANRLVYGQRVSPYEVLSAFSRRMAGALSVDDVLPRMAEAAARGVGGPRGRVRVYVPGEADRAVAWPAESLTNSFDQTVLVLHQGVPVGEIAVAKSAGAALSSGETALLEDLAAQAGPALSNLRLTLELQTRLAQLAQQTEELRASRQRIVDAQDAERRRLERDIHDGAQQNLVTIAVSARLAQQVLATNPERTSNLLDEIDAQVSDALETLRTLARGVFPALLVDRGLVAALRAHLAKSSSSARLEAGAGLARARFDPRVEAAIYFCCLEALQNAAKHASDASVSLNLIAHERSLSFEVRDTGPGFSIGSSAGAGTGLQGMADRLAAVDGVLEVISQPGGGTTVTGRVPLTDPGVAQIQPEAVADTQAALSRSEPNSPFAR